MDAGGAGAVDGEGARLWRCMASTRDLRSEMGLADAAGAGAGACACAGVDVGDLEGEDKYPSFIGAAIGVGCDGDKGAVGAVEAFGASWDGEDEDEDNEARRCCVCVCSAAGRAKAVPRVCPSLPPGAGNDRCGDDNANLLSELFPAPAAAAVCTWACACTKSAIASGLSSIPNSAMTRSVDGSRLKHSLDNGVGLGRARRPE